MASFLKTTFDNLVNNINTTINQHTNPTTGGTRAQQRQQSGPNQARNRAQATSDRPTANTSASNRGVAGSRGDLRFQTHIPASSRRQQQSSPNTFRSTNHQQSSRTPCPFQHSHNPHNHQYHQQNNCNSSSHLNSNATSPQGHADIPEVTNMSSTATENKLDIGDIRDPQDINELSVKQLKIILTRNCVDYKGIFEKEVLREKVMQLWIDCNQKKATSAAQNQAGSQDFSDDIDEKQACKICMEREINCVLLECGHMLTCVTCGRKLAECPVCRQNVSRCVRTFKG